ncbi:MAG: hypothetical protein J6D52_13130 [Clostridia bacterium]|nr:hypothetical protein [Clostridia bacterium]
MWNKKYTGLFEYKEKTFYIKNGKWDSSITAVVKINGEWVGIKNGKLFEFGGLIKYKGKWFYIEDGKWDKKITGIIRYDLKHFYVENGKWAKKTLLCKYNNGGSWGEYEWCYVKNGVWEYEPDTEQLVKYKGKWFYIENSYWNKSATMLFKYKGKWLYIEDGKWSKKRLIFSYKNQYFYIKDGIAQLDFSGYINIYGTRLKITNGKLK